MNLFVLLEVIKYMLYAGYCGEISNQSLNRVYKLSSSPNLRFQTRLFCNGWQSLRTTAVWNVSKCLYLMISKRLLQTDWSSSANRASFKKAMPFTNHNRTTYAIQTRTALRRLPHITGHMHSQWQPWGAFLGDPILVTYSDTVITRQLLPAYLLRHYATQLSPKMVRSTRTVSAKSLIGVIT